MSTYWFHLYKILENVIYGDSKQISDYEYGHAERGKREQLSKGKGRCLREMSIFSLKIVVMV